MGCEQCKLLDASESESHENVIANVTAAEHSADPCDTAITDDATHLTSSINQFSNLATTENGVAVMEEGSPSAALQLQEDSTAGHIRSLIELCDIDSNILDSTERLEVNDEVADLSPNSTVIEEAVGPSEQVIEEQVSSEPDNSRQTEGQPPSTQGAPDPQEEGTEAPVRKRRGTVRVNSIRGHKVTRKLSINPGDAIISTTQRDFVQLGGHLGHFHIAGPGALWKQQAKDGEIEAKVLKELNESSLHAYVPDFLGTKEHDGKRWIGMEDVLCHFTDGCGMDIKMGTRTFKEFEVKNQKLREDLYEKMVKQDPSEPTEQENIDKAVTKLRYMTFRERESSSQTLGFRVEAMKIWGQSTNKDFKTLKYKDQVKNALKIYFNPLGRSGIEGFLRELENLTQLLEESTYFKEHEFVGTSLLFVYDRERVGIWLIDFGKTTEISELVEGGQITHDKPWELGNYEDGYFFGLRSLLTVVQEIYDEREEGEETSQQYTTIRVN